MKSIQFIHDQRNGRQLNINSDSEDFQIEQNRNVDDIENIEMESEVHETEYIPSPPASPILSVSKIIKRTPLQKLSNFTMECDRYNISDRAAAALASSTLKDYNIVDENADPIVIDKNKVRRERSKSRNIATKENRHTDKIIISFSFDSKKNRTLVYKRMDDNVLHPRLVFETNFVILKEPGSIFIGYAVASETEKSPEIAKLLLDFCSEKGFDFSSVIAIGCDGEPKNTGKNNGVIRNIEISLQRPVHWLICLLHFNELPFRHLFQKIDGSVTTGPKSTTGKIAQALHDVNIPVCFAIFYYI